MAILVTGGGGYIGSHMAHALVDAGEPVVVIDNLTTGFRSALPESATLAIGDVGDQALLTSVIKTHAVTEIIHFAASIVVPDSVRDPLGYYRNNTINTRALLEVAVATGVQRFIFSSTAAVYGNPQRVPVGEDAPVVPMSPYGNSKLMSEIMLKDAAAAHGLSYVILRYFNVAGADPRLRSGCGRRSRCSAPTTTHPMAPASATISTSSISCAHILMRSRICGAAARVTRSTAAMATAIRCSTSSAP